MSIKRLVQVHYQLSHYHLSERYLYEALVPYLSYHFSGNRWRLSDLPQETNAEFK